MGSPVHTRDSSLHLSRDESTSSRELVENLLWTISRNQTRYSIYAWWEHIPVCEGAFARKLCFVAFIFTQYFLHTICIRKAPAPALEHCCNCPFYTMARQSSSGSESPGLVVSAEFHGVLSFGLTSTHLPCCRVDLNLPMEE